MNIEDLKKVKKEKKMTLKQIAERAGLPLRTVEDVFGGKVAHPYYDTMDAIRDALGIVRTGVLLTPTETRLLTAFNGLTAEAQSTVIEMVEMMVGQTTTKKKRSII